MEEAARRFGVHRNTVRAWIKGGLPTCDDQRPALILGRQLLAFLKARREAKRSPWLAQLYSRNACARWGSP